LFVAVLVLVLGFRRADNLGGAYGIAVTLAMLIDSVLIYVVMRRIWHWRRPVAASIALPLLAIDGLFLASNSLKVPEGGWFPLLIGIVVFKLLTTWKRGRVLLMSRLSRASRRARRRASRAPRCSSRPPSIACRTRCCTT
jgi:KUP system potassium uptake protein